MAFIISLCYSPRKPKKKETTTMEVRKKNYPIDCSYLGCINELSEENTVRTAKIGHKHYKFCSNYCYEEWLKIPTTGFYLN